MISPLNSGRTVVFIDGGHVRTMVAQSGIKIDFEALAKVLCGKSELLRVYYYDAKPKDGALNPFLSALSHLDNFEVRLGTLIEYSDRRVQKGVDGLLALDLTRMAMSATGCDNAVIVGSDGDHCPSVEFAKSMGVKIVGAYWDRISFNLRKACDSTIEMNCEFLEQIRIFSESAKEILESPIVEKLPAATREAEDGAVTVISPGEVVDVLSGAVATVKDGGIAIARSGSRIHALKGSRIYFYRDVQLTGTEGFELIPCV